MSDAYFKNFENDRDLRDHLIGLLHIDSSLDNESRSGLLSTSEISELVGIGRAEISRSLSRLRKLGRIREVRKEHPRFKEAVELSRLVSTEREIKRVFGDTALTQVFVTHTIRPREPKPTAEAKKAAKVLSTDLCTFYAARLLRDHLRKHIKDELRIGVSWGFTVSKVLDHLAHLIEMGKMFSKEQNPNWDILNIVGDTHVPMNIHEISDDNPELRHLRTMGSSALFMARDLASRLRSKHHSFSAPGWVTGVNTPADRKEVDKLLERIPTYREVFMPGGTLDVAQADLILTGIGSREILDKQLVETERLKKGEFLPSELVGDCSGILLSSKGRLVELDEETEAGRIARTMIGIRAEQLRNVAESAQVEAKRSGSATRKLGVVLVAVGGEDDRKAKEKADAVRVALELRLANVLVTESAIAQFLLGN